MSLASRKFRLAALETELDPDEPQWTRRICVNAEVLKACKLAAGDLVALLSAEAAVPESPFAVGLLWPSLELEDDELNTSSVITSSARVTPSSWCIVHPILPKPSRLLPLCTRHIVEAPLLRLDEVEDPEVVLDKPIGKESTKGKALEWLLLLAKELLVDLKYVTAHLQLDISYEGRIRRFVLAPTTPKHATDADMTSRMASLSLQSEKKEDPLRTWMVKWNTEVVLNTLDSQASKPKQSMAGIAALPKEKTEDPYDTVGGLDAQIEQVRDLLEIPLTRPGLFKHYGLKPPRGILLHGPPGTGKTHLARAIAASTAAAVLIVNGPELNGAYHGETEGRLRAVFTEARAKSPCIVVLDELDAICPARSDTGGGGSEVEQRVVATLLTLLDGFSEDENERVVVVATTNRPNAIDQALRRPGRLDREIEIGFPDAAARTSILRVLLAHTPHDLSPAELTSVAEQAHGYVGADLAAVVREAGTAAIKAWTTSGTTDTEPPKLHARDLRAALPSIRPSALRMFLASGADVPVRYSDIGGLGPTIQKLRECVEWPLRHPEAFARLGVQPPRGVLLYGPPGCSKTMLVRALAHESGVNFVSIKGPELLSKYVGDSERAVRELFRKARGASPCILFFDEADAIATSRASSTTSTSEGVLISLLTEMDGVQQLKAGVTVVAASNRPEVIDSALMRPGRLDRLLYVGPPDAAGREEILRIRMKSMSIADDVDVAAIAALTDGCSGAEIMALCQEAAMLTMQKDITSLHVAQAAFLEAGQKTRRQITSDVIAQYQRWRDNSGIASV